MRLRVADLNLCCYTHWILLHGPFSYVFFFSPGFLCFDFLFFGFYASVLIDECLVLDLDWFWLICGCDAMMNVLITGLRQWRGMASSFLAVSRLNHSNDFSFHWALSILLNSTTFFFLFFEKIWWCISLFFFPPLFPRLFFFRKIPKDEFFRIKNPFFLNFLLKVLSHCWKFCDFPKFFEFLLLSWVFHDNSYHLIHVTN